MDRWAEEFEDFKFNRFYKKMTIVTISILIVVLLVLLLVLNFTFKNVSKLENRINNLEEYVTTTYNNGLEEFNSYMEENDEKSTSDELNEDKPTNESENSSESTTENDSTVNSSLETSDEANSDSSTESSDGSSNLFNGKNMKTETTSLDTQITVEGYFDSVNLTSNLDGTVNYIVNIRDINGNKYLLQGHNIDTKDTSKNSKSYRQYQLMQDIDSRVIGTNYKCTIVLDKINEKKVSQDTGEVLLDFDTYYITTWKGIGSD